MADSLQDAPPKWNVPPESDASLQTRSGRVKKIGFRAEKSKWNASSDQTLWEIWREKPTMWYARTDEPKEKELLSLLEQSYNELGLQNNAKLKIPRLIIYDYHKPRASYNELTRELVVSTNFLEILSKDQTHAMFGHMLNHHQKRNRDFGTDVVGDVVLEAADIPGAALFNNFLARRHEFRSDRAGAQIAGTEHMVAAIIAVENRIKEIQAQEKAAHENKWWRTINFINRISFPIFRPYATTRARLKKLDKFEQKLAEENQSAETPSEPKQLSGSTLAEAKQAADNITEPKARTEEEMFTMGSNVQVITTSNAKLSADLPPVANSQSREPVLSGKNLG